jgi:hypothetical protein
MEMILGGRPLAAISKSLVGTAIQELSPEQTTNQAPMPRLGVHPGVCPGGSLGVSQGVPLGGLLEVPWGDPWRSLWRVPWGPRRGGGAHRSGRGRQQKLQRQVKFEAAIDCTLKFRFCQSFCCY